MSKDILKVSSDGKDFKLEVSVTSKSEYNNLLLTLTNGADFKLIELFKEVVDLYENSKTKEGTLLKCPCGCGIAIPKAEYENIFDNIAKDGHNLRVAKPITLKQLAFLDKDLVHTKDNIAIVPTRRVFNNDAKLKLLQLLIPKDAAKIVSNGFLAATEESMQYLVFTTVKEDHDE